MNSNNNNNENNNRNMNKDISGNNNKNNNRRMSNNRNNMYKNKMGVTTRIIIGFTIIITTRITTFKRTMTSGLTVVGKRGRQTHGRTHKMFL
jgi:hypothetical protein